MSAPGPVMIDLKSAEIDSEEREMLKHPACGGVILFSRNIENPKQVASLNAQIRNISPHLLLAVDQEGGRVQRLKDGFTILPPLREIDKSATNQEMREQLLKAHATIMVLETLSVGFDFSFTPVLDIATELSRVIGDRAFHESPEEVALLGDIYIQQMSSLGMSATGKHFPGHGTVEADSHVEVPVDRRALKEIESADLVPFAKLAKKLGAIMPAHVVYPDADELPAGFSPYWLQEVLRKKYAFTGVIFSDDLSMKGAEQVGNFKARADAALHAGCDMVLVCNDSSAAGDTLEHLVNFKNDESAKRLLSMRAKPHKLQHDLLSIDTRWKASKQQLQKHFDIN